MTRRMGRRRPRGAALLVLATLLVLALTAVMLGGLSGARAAAARERTTALALSRAHEALVAFAVSVNPDTAAKRPGDLPCPDLDNDGDAEATCIQPSQRLGRLPWKTLGIADLRDAAGERLWYAVSVHFKRNNTNPCPTAGGANCLNSDSSGTLTLRDQTGALIHDGSNAAGALALIIAPGPVLTRQGAIAAQLRSCTGDANPTLCQQTGRCSATTTPVCNAVNYLDRVAPPVMSIAGTSGNAEDNADIVEGVSANGFIQGPILDSGGETVLNDRIMVVRYEDVLPKLEARIARTTLQCLLDYASMSAGRFPWAASVAADYTLALPDQALLTFGRLPNTLTQTVSQSGMSATWPADCPISNLANGHKWWANWQNLVFFAIAPAFAPNGAAAGCGACLIVDPPASVQDKHVVVVVAARALAGQVRGVSAATSAYLEGTNSAGSSFTQHAANATFNDRVVFQ